ncbi:hypothetical protein D3C73_1281310 [compost metagenome]
MASTTLKAIKPSEAMMAVAASGPLSRSRVIRMMESASPALSRMRSVGCGRPASSKARRIPSKRSEICEESKVIPGT